MTITHRITDDILADYAAGNLPEAFSLVVAAHVSLSREARLRLDALEEIGGALLEQEPQVAVSASSFEATMARIQNTQPEAPTQQETRPCDVLPAPVRAYVGGTLDDVRWRSVGMGVKQAILHNSPDATARLLSIPGGSAMPDHGHQGMEMTMVLQGAFLDGDERFARGDVEVADEHLNHTPIADVGADCICLVACEGSLRFSGLIPRIAQPFLKL